MGRASADFSNSGRNAPARRRLRGFRFRRHRSPTPISADDATSQDLTPLSSAAPSSSQQPSLHLPFPHNAAMASSVVITLTLPVFRGDPGECPYAHLDRLDSACDAASATAARIFPASLDAEAALWFKLTVAGVEAPPWDAVRAAFLDFFRPPDAADRARGELKDLRQRDGEAINRYHLRTLGIIRQIQDEGGGGADDPSLTDAFVGGLRAEFKEWVAPQRPAALDDAVALALAWERAEGVREARRAAKEACAAAAVENKCGVCGMEGHEGARCDVWRRMGELWRSSSVGGGDMAAKDGGEEEEGGGSKKTMARLGSAVSTRSTQCRCRKHQCSKKSVVAASEVACGEGNDHAPAAAGQVAEAEGTTTVYNLMDL
ncbi:hypothetical protein QOZ80_1BG0050860 [Eleusine coracana subsp. coracana]|nr:hypothetical protein QOZ80_1BG0050860 [Eleusine coracana subsp. coracana]